MKENNENKFQTIIDKFKIISQELFEESKLKYPSHYKLESSATKMMQILKENKIDDAKYNSWKSWKLRELDIFIADLVGELHHDYDKRLVRYRGKWTKEQNKIDTIISEFRQKFK